jgi:hypothetical protein
VTAATDAARAPLERTRRQSLPHGGRHRAPILRQPTGQVALRDRYPPRPPAADWPATQTSTGDLLADLARVGFHTTDTEQRKVRRRGMRAVLDWLTAQPDSTWQQRWQASGAQDITSNGWIAVPLSWHAAHGRPQPYVKER